MSQTKSNSLKSRIEYEYNGVLFHLVPLTNPGGVGNCRHCDLFKSQGCLPAPCWKGIFKLQSTIEPKVVGLTERIAILLDTASFETESDVTTAYIPLHYSGIMDDVLEMMKIKSTMGTFKEKSSFLRAYNIHTSDFKRICENN